MSDNAMNGTMKLISWTAGIVAFLITIYTVFHVPLVGAINKEAETRQAEDQKLLQCIAGNKDTLSEIKVMLAEQRADIKYIKRETVNERTN